jgi:SAM-dependent methyltransferase
VTVPRWHTSFVPDLPLPRAFLTELRALEDSYLVTDDPLAGSGFGGGPEPWRAERSPMLEAVDADGAFLDVGCANGYLLECLVQWAAGRGISLDPHGVDMGTRLVAAARERRPEAATSLHVGNAWDWVPPRRYDYVYALADQVPESLLDQHLARVMNQFVQPGGRLILGDYGSRSHGISPRDVEAILARQWTVAGASSGGYPVVTRFAWADRPSN